MPELNWGPLLTIFICFYILQLCCWEIFLFVCFLSRTTSYFSQFCFLSISVLLCWIFSLLFPHHFFLFSISFQNISAIQNGAIPFVCLYVSFPLNLLPILILYFQFFLSCSVLSFNVSVFLPSLFQDTLYFILLCYFILYAQTADLCLPQLAAPWDSTFVISSENHRLFNVLWGVGWQGRFVQIPLNTWASSLSSTSLLFISLLIHG